MTNRQLVNVYAALNNLRNVETARMPVSVASKILFITNKLKGEVSSIMKDANEEAKEELQTDLSSVLENESKTFDELEAPRLTVAEISSIGCGVTLPELEALEPIMISGE